MSGKLNCSRKIRQDFSCALCEKRYTTKQSLQHHIDQKHTTAPTSPDSFQIVADPEKHPQKPENAYMMNDVLPPGHENFSYINAEWFVTVIDRNKETGTHFMIRDLYHSLFKEMYCNDLHPENRNVFYDLRAGNRNLMTCEKDGWRIEEKRSVLRLRHVQMYGVMIRSLTPLTLPSNKHSDAANYIESGFSHNFETRMHNDFILECLVRNAATVPIEFKTMMFKRLTAPP